MRIGISGCHNSGKTTLMKAIAEKYPAPIITGVAHKFTKTDRTCLDTQYSILKALIKEEKKYDNFIHDRTIFDGLAYFNRRYLKGERNHLTAKIYGQYFGTFVEHAQSHPYDLVIFIDDILPLEDNGVRDMEGQEEIYNFLTQAVPLYTEQFGIPCIKVRGSTELRMKKINSLVKKIYSQKRVTDF